MGVAPRSRDRTRDAVKADIIKAWEEGVSEIVLPEAEPQGEVGGAAEVGEEA